MLRSPRPAWIISLAFVVACGGSAPTVATSPTPAAATPTAIPASTAAAAASATAAGTAAPPQAGVGSVSAKLSEVKTTLLANAHIGFIGEEQGLTPGAYVETLNVVTLQPGGRTVSHKHAGIEYVIVLDGSVEIRMGGGGRVMLAAGQNARVPANTPLQASNAGSSVAKFLAFFVTADGQPFQTNLDTVP